MKKCVLLFLSLFATITVSGQEAGNRIYGNTGYYAQKRHLEINTGNLGNSSEGYVGNRVERCVHRFHYPESRLRLQSVWHTGHREFHRIRDQENGCHSLQASRTVRKDRKRGRLIARSLI